MISRIYSSHLGNSPSIIYLPSSAWNEGAKLEKETLHPFAKATGDLPTLKLREAGKSRNT